MTREEAIELLEKEKVYMIGHGGDRQAKALEMATKALEQEPCEDAISRQAMLEYQQYLHGKMSNEENHKLWEFIKELPPVTPTRKEWIPVSERLPEENGGYLVTVKRGYVTTALWLGDAEKWSAVDAWMPLPEPYKADMRGGEDGSN